MVIKECKFLVCRRLKLDLDLRLDFIRRRFISSYYFISRSDGGKLWRFSIILTQGVLLCYCTRWLSLGVQFFLQRVYDV